MLIPDDLLDEVISSIELFIGHTPPGVNPWTDQARQDQKACLTRLRALRSTTVEEKGAFAAALEVMHPDYFDAPVTMTRNELNSQLSDAHTNGFLLGEKAAQARATPASQQESGDGWQDISTAPIGHPREGILFLRWPLGPGELWPRYGVGSVSEIQGDQIVWDWPWGGSPTHWQPLPKSPGETP